MTYNIHPIIVHFPIALLFAYSILRILPLNKWFPHITWDPIRQTFLALGVLGAIAALITGNLAEGLIKPDPAVVEAHSTFAFATFLIYAATAAGEVASYFNKKFPIILVILSIVGLITLMTTGLLGGVMVYGTSADPLAPIVLKLLGITF
jgi:uncharacterized membrane protein